MPKLVTFSLGFVSGIASIILIGFIFFLRTMNGSEGVDLYPMGSGCYLDSPDNQFVAHASNFTDKQGEDLISYYEFDIKDKKTNTLIVQHRIYLSDDKPSKVHFRGGIGKVTWNQDSTEVSFGSDNELIWHYKLPL